LAEKSANKKISLSHPFFVSLTNKTQPSLRANSETLRTLGGTKETENLSAPFKIALFPSKYARIPSHAFCGILLSSQTNFAELLRNGREWKLNHQKN
jgi:hypothetical protein